MNEEDKRVLLDNIDRAFEKAKNEAAVLMYRFSVSEEEPTVFDSSVGGVGYVPKDANVPTDSKGNQLRLLAQINCEDIDLEEFPKSGLLQFWILHDELAGMDWRNQTKQDAFRVVYYEQLDKTVTKQDVLSKFKSTLEYFNPIKSETGFKIVFKQENDFGGRKFNDVFVKCYNEFYPESHIKCLNDIPISYNERYECIDSEIFSQSMGHKIGGFPGFTQGEPREIGDSHNYLLFQLDSDYDGLSFQKDFKERVMWGDSGICNFFINKEKLKAKDFSDVLYNWDCC